MSKRNLTLLGALLIQSSVPSEWPKAARKVAEKARMEMTSTLEDEQYALYEKSDHIGFTHDTLDHGEDDG